MRRYQLNGGVRLMAEFAYKEAVDAKRPELSLAIIGTSLLFFGWFGFNGGSTLAVSEQTGYAIANTAVAGSLGGFVALLLSKAAERAWSPIMAISGIMGGLVMITPLASFIEPALAFVAGVVADVITYYGMPVLAYGGFGFVAVQWLGMMLALGFVVVTTYVFVSIVVD